MPVPSPEVPPSAELLSQGAPFAATGEVTTPDGHTLAWSITLAIQPPPAAATTEET